MIATSREHMMALRVILGWVSIFALLSLVGKSNGPLSLGTQPQPPYEYISVSTLALVN